MPVPELQKFREKYPDYGDLDDATLAGKLATKYPDAYGDLPGKVAASTPETDTMPRSMGKWKEIGGKVENLPMAAAQDIGEAAKGLYTAVVHPVQTFEGVKNFIAGAAAATPGARGTYTEQERAAFEPTRQVIAESIKNPAGIPGRVGNYALEHPINTLMNVSGVGGLLRKGAEVGNMGRLAGMAGALEKYTNPVAGMASSVEALKPLVTKGVGKLASETLGATTGSGPGAVREAVKGGDAFEKALRGHISGEEVVHNAKEALQTIKEKRGAEYRARLQQMNTTGVQTSINTDSITNKLQDLMKQYNIHVSPGPNGTLNFDTSKIAMGRRGIGDIEDVIKKMKTWDDRTPLGLDTLKRQLDDFYSESGQARAFVANLRREVANTITKNVPGYGEMTKGYAQATGLIKDIESNLMLRKEGMSGRITADQTLRRLSSALRENFEMRKDLLDALGRESGTDLAGQVAGYSMSQIMPHGLIGKLGAGSALIYLNPKMWPLIAASSPRAMGEFVNAYGKALRATGTAREAAGTAAKAVSKPMPSNMLYQAGRANQ